MKLVISLLVLGCALFEAVGHPYPVHTSSRNVDTWSYGDAERGGRVLSRFHSPYDNRRAVRAPPTTYALWQSEANQRNYPLSHHQAIQYHQADRRRQALLEVNDTPPQENAVYNPQAPEYVIPNIPDEATELITPLEQADIGPSTVKAIVPELTESEIEEPQEEPVQQAKKVVNKKKQVKRPVEDEEDDDEEDFPAHRFLSGAAFPMFFGWGGSGGPVAVANAYSTGRGGAAASDATAYGTLPPIRKSQKNV